MDVRKVYIVILNTSIGEDVKGVYSTKANAIENVENMIKSRFFVDPEEEDEHTREYYHLQFDEEEWVISVWNTDTNKPLYNITYPNWHFA